MIILLPTHLAEILVDFPHHQWFAHVIITDLSSFDLIMPALIVFIPPPHPRLRPSFLVPSLWVSNAWDEHRGRCSR